MPGPARFLYGLALGLSLGVIWTRLIASAQSPPHRRAASAAASRSPGEKRPRQKTARR